MKDCLKQNSSKVNPINVINAILITMVLFLHHAGYTTNYFYFLDIIRFNDLLQKFAVGGFFFFSGYKLAISNIDMPHYVFLKKRLLRVYLLYLAALVVASFTFYPFSNDGLLPSLFTFLIHLLCLQTVFPDFFGANYQTIWFISVLCFCYLLFMLVRRYLSNIKLFFVLVLTIYLSISYFYLLTMEQELRLFFKDFSTYILFFMAGMLFSRFNVQHLNKYLLLTIGVLGNTALIYIYKSIYINTLFEYTVYTILVLSSNISLFCLMCRWLKRIHLSAQMMHWISIYSAASFSIFLFHRAIWSTMASIYPESSFLQWLYIIFLGIPIILVSGHLIQHSYEVILQYSTKKPKAAN